MAQSSLLRKFPSVLLLCREVTDQGHHQSVTEQKIGFGPSSLNAVSFRLEFYLCIHVDYTCMCALYLGITLMLLYLDITMKRESRKSPCLIIVLSANTTSYVFLYSLTLCSLIFVPSYLRNGFKDQRANTSQQW